MYKKPSSVRSTVSVPGVSVIEFASAVMPDSPAEKSGLLKGDVIVKINDQDVGTVEDLQRVIRTKKIGEEVTILIFREDEYESVKVKLEERPAQ